MKRYESAAAVAFTFIIWTAILLCVGARVYDYMTGPEGLGNIRFKTVDEMNDGSP